MISKYATATDENGTVYFGTVNPKSKGINVVGTNISVLDKFVDIDMGNVGFTLEYSNCNAPPTTVKTTGRSLIDDLNRKGYLVSRSNSDHVTEYVMEQLEQLKCRNVFSNLGWRFINGKLQFRGHKLLSSDKTEAGTYVGNYDIEPKGTKEGLIADMQKCILGKPFLELSMILGLSSCVVGYLGCFSSVESLVANIYGRSTTGKTTCANLAVSMCCNPSPGIGKQSLSHTWYGTENGLFANLAQNCGFTILYDEIGMKDKSLDVVNFIYGICSGKSKTRANKSGNLALRRAWNTTFISTGEHSLFSDSKPPDGMSVRVLNFGNLQWTDSSEQCREIERFTQEHYGLPIMLLAEYMLTLDSQEVRNRYQKIIDNLISTIKMKHAYIDRIAKIVAVLILTGELFGECCKIQFDMETLQRILIRVVKLNTPESESIRAFNDILQMVEKNKSRFNTSLGAEVTWYKEFSSYYGAIKFKEAKDKHCHSGRCEEDKIYILSSVFDDWMKELGYQNKANILREWRDSKLLVTKDTTHIHSKVRISDGGILQKCICLNLDANSELTLRRNDDDFIHHWGDCAHHQMCERLNNTSKSLKVLEERNIILRRRAYQDPDAFLKNM